MSQPNALWYTRCGVPTTSGVAQHYHWLHGEFARSGIAVESIRASDDPAIRISHFDHSVANSFREGGNVPPLWARGNGQDTLLVGITWIDEEQLILVREDSSITSLDQLKGARLGLPRREGGIVDVGRAQDLRGLLTALHIAGVARDEATFVDLKQTAAPDLRERRDNAGLRDWTSEAARSLLDGAVDAIYAKGAFSATLIEEHGFRPILDINRQEDPLLRVNAGTPRPITVSGDLVRNHPELVARYLAVLQKTAQWALTHPTEVAQAIAAETGATETAVQRGFGPKLHERFAVSLSPLYVQGLRLQKDFLVEEEFIADFDFDGWIDEGPLHRANEIADSILLVNGSELATAAE